MAVEKRRASVLRASGHTFEYLGYGPGNYSTAFPEKQNKILTREAKFLAQSTIDNGGSVVYTGVNDAGDFHIGTKLLTHRMVQKLHSIFQFQLQQDLHLLILMQQAED